MHKNIFGRQLKRDVNERKALFKGLMTSLVMHERIVTTEEKAKSIRGSVEKLVTKAKKKGIQARPLLLPYLHEDAVERLITDVAPRFSTRPGGYTRIIKIGRRFGDNASTVVMEWVEKSSKLKVPHFAEASRGKQSEKSKKTVNNSEEMQADLETKTVAKKGNKKLATAETQKDKDTQKKKEIQKENKAKKGEKKK